MRLIEIVAMPDFRTKLFYYALHQDGCFSGMNRFKDKQYSISISFFLHAFSRKMPQRCYVPSKLEVIENS